MITKDLPGTTRDAISLFWEYEDHKFELIDNPGIYKKYYHNNKTTNVIEMMMIKNAVKSIKKSDVILFMIEPYDPLSNAEMHLINYILEIGKGLVILMNKGDTENKKLLSEKAKYIYACQFNNLSKAPVITCSTKIKTNLLKPIQEAIKIYTKLNTKLSTSSINKTLQLAQNNHPHRLSHRKTEVKFKYATQIEQNPLTIKIFSNTDKIEQSYIKYLSKYFQKNFNLYGFIIKLVFEKSNNPYQKTK